MKKGAKRKTHPASAAEPTRAATRAKRVKTKPPEYVKEPRNLEDLWKAVFPVGTEWDQLGKLYSLDWDFSNLETEFEDESGRFRSIVAAGNHVYLFAQTETSSPSDPILISTLNAVLAPRPSSDQIAIQSVQREYTEFIPMKQMKMDWIPYIPLHQRDSEISKSNGSGFPKIFVLRCSQRKASLKHMNQDRWMKFQYCMPYLTNPKEEEAATEASTVINTLFPREPLAPLLVEFDWEFDNVEEFADERIEAEELNEDEKEGFTEFLKEEVKTAKRKIREEREARRRRMEDPRCQEEKAYFESLKIYKIYPVAAKNDPTIEMKFKSKYVNFYYGKAHEII